MTVAAVTTKQPITPSTESTLGNGIVASENGFLRLATNAEIVTEAELTAALAAYLPLAGGVATGLISFSGTSHAGIRLNNLTTTQRNAIGSPAAGSLIWNTTDSRVQVHNGTAWTNGFARIDGDTFTGNVIVPSIRFTNVVNDVAIESIVLRNGFVGQPVIINGLDAISRGTGLAAFRAYAAIGTNAIQVATAIGQPIAFNVDGSGNAFATALETRNATSPTSVTVQNRFTSATNRETGFVRWVSDVLQIGTEKGSLGGAARALHLQTDGVTRVTIGTTGAIILSGLPTTNPGVAGQVWNDGGNLRIA